MGRSFSLGALALLAALAPIGCKPSRSGPRPAEAIVPEPSGSPAALRRPAPAAPLDAPRSHLLLERHAAADPRARLLPVDLASNALLPEADAPAMERPDWEGHFVFVAAHGGGLTWASAEKDGEGFALRVRKLGADGTRDAPLPGRAAALHVAGDTVLVGTQAAVGFVDLAEAKLVWREARRREEMRYKAYDLFVRSGSWLVAIDDVVTPVFADSFRLDARGRPAHGAGWTLPGLINGHYLRAALRPSGERSGTLFALAPYGIMSGNGQDLAALPIVDDQLKVPEHLVLNAQRRDDPPVLEEHVSRSTKKPEKLAYGSDFTPWLGLALHGDRLLLAAGARGLLVVPASFTPDTRAQAVEVGGECLDVLAEGGRVWALVSGASNALVELQGEPLRPGARTALPGRFERFVR